MAEKEIHCTSCKKKIENLSDAVRFKCPNCEKRNIIRCRECRARSIKYICNHCNFEGPN